MTSTMTNWKIYVIQPAGRTNYVTNPSAEIDATGYGGLNATVTQSSEQARYGTYSVKAVPTAANDVAIVEYQISAPTTGTVTMSVSVKGEAGKTYTIQLYDEGSDTISGLTFTANGYWQRRGVSHAVTTGDALYLYIYRDADQDTTAAYYTDGWQLEVGSTPSTYFDGSMDFLGNVRGRTEYYWTGTPYASTSVRVDWTNSGGTMLDLSTYCRIIAVLGLGMAQITPIYAPMVNGGSIYQWSRAGNRDISLVLDFNGANPGDVAQKISAVQKAFDATSNKYGQPTRLMLVGYNAAGAIEQSETLFVDVAYRGGLEGGFTSHKHEGKNVQLLNFTPTMRAEGYTTAALDWQDALTGYNLIRETPSGTIDNFGITTGVTGATYAMAKGPDGNYYIVGLFGDLNGIAEADCIAKYDAASGTWGAMVGLNSSVYDIVFQSDGKPIIGGAFTDASGVATADKIARWTGSAWESITTGGAITGTAVYTMAYSRTGTLYVGGNFSAINGVTTAYIARWDGSTWAVVGSASALNGIVYDIIPDPWGDGVIVAGAFTDAGGVTAADYLARVSVSGSTYTWSAITTAAPNAAVYGLHYDSQLGRLYIVGDFTAVGGAGANYIAYYDGDQWRTMGSGLGDTPGNIVGMASENGRLYIGASFLSAGGLSVPDGWATYAGNQWSRRWFDESGTGSGRGVYYDNETGDLFWLGAITSATVLGRTSITNTDYGDTYPTLVITGPGTVYGIKNYSNGDRVEFNNLTLLEGQTFTVVFTPDGIISARIFAGSAANPRGGQNGGTDVTKFIVPGSSPTFRLSPGTNTVGMFIYGSTSAATAATLSWPSTYRAIEGAVR